MTPDALLRQAKRLTATLPLFVGAWDRLRKHQPPTPHVSGDSTAAALLRALSVEASETSLRAMDADLVVLASDPVEDVAAFTDVKYTLVKGSIVYAKAVSGQRE